MLHNIMLLTLAPALLYQGKRVRATTPRLPEASGPRAGQAGKGPSLHLLILGDSAAAGVGAKDQSIALSGQLVDRLSQHYQVHWTLEALTGRKVADYLPPPDATTETAASHLPSCDADIVVVSLGVNDVTSKCSVSGWLKQVDRLIAGINQQYAPDRILFTAVPPMERFPVLPQPLRRYLGERARAFNMGLARRVGGYPNVDLIGVQFENGPDVMATDGFHPGPGGYRMWAETLAAHIGPPA
ncbi:MAG: lipase [Alteromonadaceae bacterium]|nr:lipase [Alteromonadaceae bacterium]MBH84339.1 lipase [Alteromonadaceae bacterium]